MSFGIPVQKTKVENHSGVSKTTNIQLALCASPLTGMFADKQRSLLERFQRKISTEPKKKDRKQSGKKLLKSKAQQILNQSSQSILKTTKQLLDEIKNLKTAK